MAAAEFTHRLPPYVLDPDQYELKEEDPEHTIVVLDSDPLQAVLLKGFLQGTYEVNVALVPSWEDLLILLEQCHRIDESVSYIFASKKAFRTSQSPRERVWKQQRESLRIFYSRLEARMPPFWNFTERTFSTAEIMRRLG